MVHVSSSISTTTGVAPTLMMELMLAAKEKFGKITSSPLPIPNVFKASSNAVVPLDVVTEYPPPRYLEKLSSN